MDENIAWQRWRAAKLAQGTYLAAELAKTEKEAENLEDARGVRCEHEWLGQEVAQLQEAQAVQQAECASLAEEAMHLKDLPRMLAEELRSKHIMEEEDQVRQEFKEQEIRLLQEALEQERCKNSQLLRALRADDLGRNSSILPWQ